MKKRNNKGAIKETMTQVGTLSEWVGGGATFHFNLMAPDMKHLPLPCLRPAQFQ